MEPKLKNAYVYKRQNSGEIDNVDWGVIATSRNILAYKFVYRRSNVLILQWKCTVDRTSVKLLMFNKHTERKKTEVCFENSMHLNLDKLANI